jgi:hypothetical protein
MASASHRPVVVATMTLVGQLINGGSSSLTVTVNEHDRVLPALSVAVHVTEVVPS